MSKGYLEPIDVRSKVGRVQGKKYQEKGDNKDKVDFVSKKIVERENYDIRQFSDIKQVERVGKLHKAKRDVKIQQKRENLESSFIAIAVIARKQERNRKNNARKKAKKLAKRRK